MKITIYELIGLVKDGKAPKRIKYNDKFWCYSNSIQDYDCLNATNYLLGGLFNNLTIDTFINNEVEIIEENKNIERISWNEKESLSGNLTAIKKQEILARRTEKLKKVLNQLIDKINNLKEND